MNFLNKVLFYALYLVIIVSTSLVLVSIIKGITYLLLRYGYCAEDKNKIVYRAVLWIDTSLSGVIPLYRKALIFLCYVIGIAAILVSITSMM